MFPSLKLHWCRAVLLCFAFISFTGCTLTDSRVDLAYKPLTTSTPIPGAAGVSVDVNGSDARTANRDRIGTKESGAYHGGGVFAVVGASASPGALIPNQDVAQFVAKSMAAELAARGFSLAAGHAHLNLAVTQFYERTYIALFGAGTNATVSFDATVLSPAGVKTFERSYTAPVHSEYTFTATDNALQALMGALQNALAKAIADPDLIRAIETAATTP